MRNCFIKLSKAFVVSPVKKHLNDMENMLITHGHVTADAVSAEDGDEFLIFCRRLKKKMSHLFLTFRRKAERRKLNGNKQNYHKHYLAKQWLPS